MKSTTSTVRIRIVSGLFIFLSLILISKLYMVQIVHSDIYSDKADRQYTRPGSSQFNRGNIFFTTKDGERVGAATTKRGYTIAINPSTLASPEDIYNVLSSKFEIDDQEFMEAANKTDDPYEEILTRVPMEDGKEIAESSLKGVSVLKEKWRFYPGKSMAAQTIGFMSYTDDDEYRGQYGLERYYEDILNRNEDTLYSNFFVEIFSGITKTLKGEEKQGSVVTSIEPSVQTFVEKELQGLQDKWGSRQSGAIVMDPNTGEIYSMSVVPGFDLNTFNMVEDPKIYSNPLVESVYEMGSVMKPLTMAIGIDRGVVSADSTYEDTGSITLDDYTIYNHDEKTHGIVTMQDMINKSLNLGAAFVAARVGAEPFAEYMTKLLSEKTEIDLPNEASPLVSNLETRRPIEIANASFGQGLALTPIGMTRAISSLANGGYMVDPHIVKEIDYEVGTKKTIEGKKGRKIFKDGTTEEVTTMLVTAVDEALRGGTLALPNHTVAAKTGTAQIANEVSGGYYEDRVLHTMFGYFPAYEPRFVVFIYTLEPRGVQYSSDTLPEPLMNISRYLINYYEIPPDREPAGIEEVSET